METQGQAGLTGQGGAGGYGELAARRTAREIIIEASPRYAPTAPFRSAMDVADEVARPVGEVIKMLLRQLDTDVVRPLLAAPTREELLDELRRKWQGYQGTISTLSNLAADQPEAAAHSIEASVEILASRAMQVAGPAAADEVRFVLETYASAVRLTARFESLPGARDAEEDWRVWVGFTNACSLHNLGVMMICEAGSGAHASAAGLEAAFEFFRGGALDAYVAARAAFALREHGEEVVDEPLPFDEEDDALASAP